MRAVPRARCTDPSSRKWAASCWSSPFRCGVEEVAQPDSMALTTSVGAGAVRASPPGFCAAPPADEAWSCVPLARTIADPGGPYDHRNLSLWERELRDRRPADADPVLPR